MSASRLGDDQVLSFAGEGFAEGDRVRAVVDWTRRFPTMANHTATHLLHGALREVLGEHVAPGGLGRAARQAALRLHAPAGAHAPRSASEVERLVNERIFPNLPVRAFVTPIEEARKLGAMMLFGEKYGDEVRVVEIDAVSRELCGGTHVRPTAEIGPFVISARVGRLRDAAHRGADRGRGVRVPARARRARPASCARSQRQRARIANAKPRPTPGLNHAADQGRRRARRWSSR